MKGATMTLIRDGGFGIWIVIVFGLICLGDAILIARRADERKLAFLRAMSLAVVGASLSGFTAGVAMAIRGTSRISPEHHPDWPLLVLKGCGEALSIVVMGSTLLALAWFIAAIGVRRRPVEERPAA
jgi:hypothetical protein